MRSGRAQRLVALLGYEFPHLESTNLLGVGKNPKKLSYSLATPPAGTTDRYFFELGGGLFDIPGERLEHRRYIPASEVAVGLLDQGGVLLFARP